MNIPLFYRPSQIGILEDDCSFAQTCSRIVEATGNISKIYSSSQEFIEEFSDTTSEMYVRDVLVDREEIDYGLHCLKIHLPLLPKLLYKEKPILRSVALVDYSMPFGKGTEILEKINNSFLRSILLTGIADEKIAVDAFNKGSINQYLRKQEENLGEKISHYIKRMTWEYFTIFSRFLLDKMEDSYGFLQNPTLGEWLYDFVQEKDLVSFCILSTDGIFLTKNKDGDFYVLKILFPQAELEFIRNSVEGIQEQEDMFDLPLHKTFLFFKNGHYAFPINDRERFMFDIKTQKNIAYVFVPIEEVGESSFF